MKIGRGSVGLLAVALLLGACGDDDMTGGGEGEGEGEGETPVLTGPGIQDLSCRPADNNDLYDMHGLYVQARRATDELSLRGDVQTDLAISVIGHVLVSQPAIDDFFAVEANQRWVPSGDGAWHKSLGGESASVVVGARFFEPNGTPITVDPFDMGSYITGTTVGVTSQTDDAVTDASMAESASTHFDIDIAYDGLGPLGHLLDGGLSEDGVIMLQLSQNELDWLLLSATGLDRTVARALGTPPLGLGALETLWQMEIEGTVALDATWDDVHVVYEAHTARTPLGEHLEGFAYTFSSYEAFGENHYLTVLDSDLRTGQTGLTGRITYIIEGRNLTLRVTTNFGDGTGAPIDTWSCPPAESAQD